VRSKTIWTILPSKAPVSAVKARDPGPPDHALFPGRGPSGDARASGRATIKFTQDDRDRSWRAPNVAPDRGDGGGGQPAALPNGGREVSNGNRKAPPLLLTGLLSLDRNGCSAWRFARRLLAGRAHIHVDFHSERHFDDFRCFPGHFGSPLIPDELVLAIKGGPNRLPVKSFVIK
jgi:hypothetical protein